MNHEILESNIRRTLPDARIVATPLTLCPAIKLLLISPDNLQRSFAAEEIQTILDRTPYWTFCWASGQALAYHVINNKEKFAQKRILDFGSGSGVVAIAAAMAGATEVFACDIDPDAIDAIKANAALNQVVIQTCQSIDEIQRPLDLIIAADVLYDRENFHYLEEFLGYAPEILVADSRAKTIAKPPYKKIAELETITLPDLEEPDDYKRVAIFQALTEGLLKTYC